MPTSSVEQKDTKTTKGRRLQTLWLRKEQKIHARTYALSDKADSQRRNNWPIKEIT